MADTKVAYPPRDPWFVASYNAYRVRARWRASPCEGTDGRRTVMWTFLVYVIAFWSIVAAITLPFVTHRLRELDEDNTTPRPVRGRANSPG